MLERENTIDELKNNKILEINNFKIQEISFVNKINLRIDPNNREYMAICGKILDIILPTKPNTYSKNNDLKAVWLSPDEWLIVNTNTNNLSDKLKSKLNTMDTSVTDVSENRTIIRISGNKLFLLLSKFLVLNLDKSLADQNSCAQTIFTKIPILILRNNDDDKIPEVDIFMNKSHTTYVYNLILDGTKNLDF
tara:strand:+ start:342 stop:920 length:579 start_codon:yes stop_codon:yes gene_type:complete